MGLDKKLARAREEGFREGFQAGLGSGFSDGQYDGFVKGFHECADMWDNVIKNTKGIGIGLQTRLKDTAARLAEENWRAIQNGTKRFAIDPKHRETKNFPFARRP